MTTQKLLELKNKKKSKNPKFMRQDQYKKKRISKTWRKPRGWDSKQRKRMQRQAIVEPGYGTPSVLRGVHRSGLIIIKVNCKEDIKKLNPKEHGVIIGKIGFKKKQEIISDLLKQKIKILNIKNPEEYIARKKEQMQKTKKEKKEDQEEKKEVKKKEDKESIEDKLSDEDKKKLEKKEIDKLLTKKF